MERVGGANEQVCGRERMERVGGARLRDNELGSVSEWTTGNEQHKHTCTPVLLGSVFEWTTGNEQHKHTCTTVLLGKFNKLLGEPHLCYWPG